MATKADGPGNHHGPHLMTFGLGSSNFRNTNEEPGRCRVAEGGFTTVVGGVGDLADPSCSRFRVRKVAVHLFPFGFRDPDQVSRLLRMLVSQSVARSITNRQRRAIT